MEISTDNKNKNTTYTTFFEIRLKSEVFDNIKTRTGVKRQDGKKTRALTARAMSSC